ncbi:putative lipoprotein YbaY [Dokdonella fugitiva]|uniref:Putative lipoprotein YbaY n=1 Tax=Dokdonella fugitiva TaxID=328517 RepID=A0A839FA25_9GAMM|nr:YbaY family lipoprotein [Dokdonella fugitiva]MBA8888974.1 putative lipoprotein YbaY [Dokdonella fugitiva]
MRPILLSIVVVALAACQSGPAPDRGGGKSVTPQQPAPVVHGRASYLERMLMSPGAVLEVQLIDDRIADAPGTAGSATVARMSYGDLHAPPYAFDLPYDPARVDAGGRYSLRATLREADGRLLFATDARVPVTPGAAAPVEFRLVRVATP